MKKETAFAVVDSIADAVKEVSAIRSLGVGGNTLYGGGSFSGGDVRNSDGKIVANVSYNGRVWQGPKSQATRVEIKPADWNDVK